MLSWSWDVTGEICETRSEDDLVCRIDPVDDLEVLPDQTKVMQTAKM